MAAMRLDLIGRYLRPHRRTVIFGAIALVVVNVLSVTIPMEVRRVIDELQEGFAYDSVPDIIVAIRFSMSLRSHSRLFAVLSSTA